MRASLGIVVLVASLGLPALGFASGGGSGSPNGNGMISNDGSMHTRSEAAKKSYVLAVRMMNAARGYEADAAAASAPEQSAKAQAKAQKYYKEALANLIDVVGLDPAMVDAWNYLGFINRKLGRYAESLDSYSKALELNPNNPRAIEYRGEAYLELNEIDDARAAYMSLFQNSRPLADELMAAMHRWTDARRKDAQGLSPEEVESFAQWIDQRAAIAAQPASLATG